MARETCRRTLLCSKRNFTWWVRFPANWSCILMEVITVFFSSYVSRGLELKCIRVTISFFFFFIILVIIIYENSIYFFFHFSGCFILMNPLNRTCTYSANFSLTVVMCWNNCSLFFRKRNGRTLRLFSVRSLAMGVCQHSDN